MLDGCRDPGDEELIREGAGDLIELVGVEQLERGGPDQLGRVVAERPFVGRAREHEPAFAVVDRDQVMGVLHQGPEPALGGTLGRFGRHPIRDVDGAGVDHHSGDAGLGRLVREHDFEVAPGPVAVEGARRDRGARVPRPGERLVRLVDPVPVVGVHELEAPAPEELVGPVPQDLLDRRAEPLHDASGVTDPDDAPGLLEPGPDRTGVTGRLAWVGAGRGPPGAHGACE